MMIMQNPKARRFIDTCFLLSLHSRKHSKARDAPVAAAITKPIILVFASKNNIIATGTNLL
jgi:hypothetical protein